MNTHHYKATAEHSQDTKDPTARQTVSATTDGC